MRFEFLFSRHPVGSQLELYVQLQHPSSPEVHEVTLRQTDMTTIFMATIVCCVQAGAYWLELLSYYSGGWSLILVALVESIVFGWFYGKPLFDSCISIGHV